MPNVTNVVREQVVAKASPKGFFRRIAEKIGLVQREVAECKGKSLSEMAEMTSKQDTVEISKPFSKMTPVEKQLKLWDEYNALREQSSELGIKMSEISRENPYKIRSDVEHKLTLKKRELEELNQKLERKEREIGYLRRDEGDPGYSPDGDHVYFERRAESEADFKIRLEKAKDTELRPLIREQNQLRKEISGLECDLESAEAAIKDKNLRYSTLKSEKEKIEKEMNDIYHRISVIDRDRKMGLI